MRIAKRIADSGIASRREAEALIVGGRVTLNEKKLNSPAQNVATNDRITIDGKPLPPSKPLQLFLFHKPRETLTSRCDARARRCITDFLPPELKRLKPIGRLDLLSEGLLLMTTDGELARNFEHPQNAWLRRYRMRINGIYNKQTRERLAKLADGIKVNGIQYKPIAITKKKQASTKNNKPIANTHSCERSNFWIEATLHEGKNRELRIIMHALGLRVARLIRTQYGPFVLGELAAGELKVVPEKSLRKAIPDKFFKQHSQ